MSLHRPAQVAHPKGERMFTIDPADLAQIEIIHQMPGPAGVHKRSIARRYVKQVSSNQWIGYGLCVTLHVCSPLSC